MAQSAPPVGATGQVAKRNPLAALFNTDGKPHPLENTLTAVTAVLGVIAIVTCAFHSLHVIASWTGLAGVATAAVAQYKSATTAERFVIVVGGGMAAVGLGIGLARGGLI
ncbi:hypothetical protein [Streptacidiphilus jiangxiensis]|uniref:Uncharacterized protein n=1 Tax=Streptacidiphilus jiangxiensis TaxID=235985 RepID=A0A1H7JB27_STRJI|nr:hypothetical protein [Streptacidiphilus jiangxiensis]SEK71554.1 hypothetical protein SAMN05414137_103207 [Streptacidiphilus jiangxiensis]